MIQIATDIIEMFGQVYDHMLYSEYPLIFVANTYTIFEYSCLAMDNSVLLGEEMDWIWHNLIRPLDTIQKTVLVQQYQDNRDILDIIVSQTEAMRPTIMKKYQASEQDASLLIDQLQTLLLNDLAHQEHRMHNHQRR